MRVSRGIVSHYDVKKNGVCEGGRWTRDDRRVQDVFISQTLVKNRLEVIARTCPLPVF